MWWRDFLGDDIIGGDSFSKSIVIYCQVAIFISEPMSVYGRYMFSVYYPFGIIELGLLSS